MRIRFVGLFILLTLCGVAPVRAASGPTYYLALGDS
jgi:hypothetical protein